MSTSAAPSASTTMTIHTSTCMRISLTGRRAIVTRATLLGSIAARHYIAQHRREPSMPEMSLRLRAVVLALACMAACVACTVAPPAHRRRARACPCRHRLPAPAPEPAQPAPTACRRRSSVPSSRPRRRRRMARAWPRVSRTPRCAMTRRGCARAAHHFTTQQELQDTLRAIAATPRGSASPHDQAAVGRPVAARRADRGVAVHARRRRMRRRRRRRARPCC